MTTMIATACDDIMVVLNRTGGWCKLDAFPLFDEAQDGTLGLYRLAIAAGWLEANGKIETKDDGDAIWLRSRRTDRERAQR